MASWIRGGLTYANVVGTLALFIALGGVSYAAVKLPAKSVGTKQLKTGAVTSAKVRDGSLLAKDFDDKELPRGETGEPARTAGRARPARQAPRATPVLRAPRVRRAPRVPLVPPDLTVRRARPATPGRAARRDRPGRPARTASREHRAPPARRVPRAPAALPDCRVPAAS